MAKKLFASLLMLVCLATFAQAGLAAEPTLNQVYQAAEAGKLGEAQTMMQEVLRAHPDSAKAHFVEAELLAKQGMIQKARSELDKAEMLAPGLAFAKPQAVQKLKTLIDGAHVERLSAIPGTSSGLAARGTSFPWGMLFVGIGLVAFIVAVARFMSQRNAVPPSVRQSNGVGYGGTSFGSPAPAYGMGGVGSAGVAGQGLGASMLGGLATGAAVGAGVVAGEALMHRFMGDSGSHVSNSALPDLGPRADDFVPDDLGGADFGISDSSSWDDAGGSSDWS